MPPFGSPDGQGPVLGPLLMRVVIEMPPFGSPDGQEPVLVPLLIRVVIEMPPGILSVYRGAQKSFPGSLWNRPRVRFFGVRRVRKVGPLFDPTYSYHEDRNDQKWDHFLVPFLGPTESVFFRLPSTVTDHFFGPSFGVPAPCRCW